MKRKREDSAGAPLAFTAEPEPCADDIDTSSISAAAHGRQSDARQTQTAAEPQLTRAQLAQIERNRQRALLLREARLRAHPAAGETACGGRVLRVQGSRLVDSGAGFFIDEEADGGAGGSGEPPLTERPAPLQPTDRPDCADCGRSVASSFLLDNFDCGVCDGCHKEQKEKYALITRTEARAEYLLKDPDLDRREPLLRFLTRRNPHNPRGGEMRLYLRLQVEERALQVWGSEEELEEQHQRRDAKRDKTKVNKLNRRIKELRMAVRSSVYRKELSGHEHVYGEETYNEEDETYTRSCSECSHSQTYEKM